MGDVGSEFKPEAKEAVNERCCFNVLNDDNVEEGDDEELIPLVVEQFVTTLQPSFEP